MDVLQEKKPLLVKAELNLDYEFKMPMESYRFSIMYIGGMDPPNKQEFPLTPDECYKKEDN